MKLGYRPDEAATVVGSRQLFDEMVKAGWLQPKVDRHKMVIFDFADIAGCWQRIKNGELPPSIYQEKKKRAKARAAEAKAGEAKAA